MLLQLGLGFNVGVLEDALRGDHLSPTAPSRFKTKERNRRASRVRHHQLPCLRLVCRCARSKERDYGMRVCARASCYLVVIMHRILQCHALSRQVGSPKQAQVIPSFRPTCRHEARGAAATSEPCRHRSAQDPKSRQSRQRATQYGALAIRYALTIRYAWRQARGRIKEGCFVCG